MSNTPDRLERRLGAGGAAMVVIGVAVGSGIFVVPGAIAAIALSPGPFLLAWVLAGVSALCMALVYTELAPMFPEAGGGYVFIKKAFGAPAGFAYGWSLMVGTNAALIALFAVSFTTYLAYFVPLTPDQRKMAAMGLIFVLTAVNVRGVAFGALVQNIFTAGKLAALAVLVIAGLLVFHVTNLHPFVGDAGWGTTAAAAVPALLAFGGYNALAYISEEVKNPSRNIPLGLVGGMAVVIGVYLLVNVVVIAGVPMTDLGQSSSALTLVATRAMGGIGGALVAIGAMISIFGSLNGAILAFPRLPFAMGRDKNLFGIFGDIHREYQTPYAAIIFHALLAMVYVLTSSFLTMLFMGVFISRLGEVLVVLSLAWLRRTMPNAERPVMMFAYPASAIIAGGLTLYLVACIAPLQILQGIGLILTAIPAYIFFRFWSRRAPRMRPTPAPSRSR